MPGPFITLNSFSKRLTVGVSPLMGLPHCVFVRLGNQNPDTFSRPLVTTFPFSEAVGVADPRIPALI